MRLRFILILSLFAYSFFSFSSNDVWKWAFNGGSNDHDSGNALCIDQLGSIITTGFFSNTGIFGSDTIYSHGGPDIFVAKYSRNGNCIWAKSLGSSDTTDYFGDNGTAIGVDRFGNSYVTGNFYDSAMFGNFQLNGNGSRQIFIAKLDPNGNILWAREPLSDSSASNYSYSITVDSSGNSFITGSLSDSTHVFGSFVLNGPCNFVAKYDVAGNVIFAKRIGGTRMTARAIKNDHHGNLYVTGNFRGSEIINGQVFNASSFADIFLLKMDNAGNIIWIERSYATDTSTVSYSNAISIDKAERIHIAGSYNFSIAFGPVVCPEYSLLHLNYPYTVAFDSSGLALWSATADVGLSSADYYSVDNDELLNTYVSGIRYGEINSGNCSLPVNGAQAIVMRIDSSGNCTDALTSHGGNPFAGANGISVYDECNIYTVGNFKTGTSFGSFPITNIGFDDMFIANLGCDVKNSTEQNILNGVNIYTVDDKLIFNSGILKDGVLTIYDLAGRRIFFNRFNQQTFIVNANVFNGGIYLVEVTFDVGTLFRQKIFLE